MEDGVNYIGGGSYRNVFLVDQHNSDPEMALKVAEMGLSYVSLYLCEQARMVTEVERESGVYRRALLHYNETGSTRLRIHAHGRKCE